MRILAGPRAAAARSAHGFHGFLVAIAACVSVALGASSALAGPAAPAAPAEQGRYLEDFEFIRTTVAREGASVRSRSIDWNGVCAALRPEFERAASDRDHVRNVLRLLAGLRDSHTGVTRSSVPWAELPSKWDGLYGGGLWFGWEDGRVMLRGVMEGHSLRGKVPLGSTLVAIGGKPAWLVLQEEKRRIVEHQGSSSDHSLFASLGNRLLPFGDAQTLDLAFLTPTLEIVEVKAPRWGPGGKAFSPATVQLPEGLAWREGAVAGLLRAEGSEKVGYIRITGSMDEATVKGFHAAFDELREAEAILLDCRGMGGGGDSQAWEMAGRFFTERVPNGPGRAIEPSGSWQFAGPVAMLQDELEVSSAETFTWALSETERALSVGRPTGGWGIIPKVFRCPSGLVDFRLGVNDRPTPIRGIRTEGVGWPPDLLVPYGPVLCAEPDPARDIALQALRLLRAGVPRKAVVGLFGTLLSGDAKGFLKAAGAVSKKAKGWDPRPLAEKVAADLGATLSLERSLLDRPEILAPDYRGASGRLAALLDRAKAARLTADASAFKKTVEKGRAEAAAQDALLALLASGEGEDPEARRKFIRSHGKTRVGRYAATELWK